MVQKHFKCTSVSIIFASCLLIQICSANLYIATEPCECKFLIPRIIITEDKCGECARCWWDLYTYGYIFKDIAKKGSDFFTSAWMKYANASFIECVRDIPYPSTFEGKDNCRVLNDICEKKTEEMFLNQCSNIFDSPYPPPPSLTDDDIDIENSRLALKEVKQFNGKNFYPITCPMFYRRVYFTYYLLYGQAYTHYGVPKNDENYWDENKSLFNLAPQISKQSVKDADGDISNSYSFLGIPLNRKKFCGYADVFICVD